MALPKKGPGCSEDRFANVPIQNRHQAHTVPNAANRIKINKKKEYKF